MVCSIRISQIYAGSRALACDHDEHITQGELPMPILLQCVNANTATVLIDIRVPYPSAERRFGRVLWIILGYLQMKFPHSLRIWCTLRTGNEGNELREIFWNFRVIRGREEIVRRESCCVKSCVISSKSSKCR